MRKFLKSLLIPAKDNNFLPKIIGFRALVLYCFLSVVIFFLISPVFVQINKLLADLTQDLIIKEINPLRTEQGFLSLKANDKLGRAAQMKAEDMIEKDYFDHISPTGKYPWEWIKEAGYDYAAAAENLAINASDPKALVSAWLNSPPHAENIMNGYFTDVGVGIAKGEINGKNTTVVVMFLGRKIPSDIQISEAVLNDLDDNVKKPAALLSTAALQDTPPEDPAITQTIDEDLLYKDNIVQAANINRAETVPDGTNAKIYLVSKLPLEARFALTIFFNLLIIWILGTYLISKERFLLRISNSLIIVALLFFLWLPELA
jgi:hypothetical protein